MNTPRFESMESRTLLSATLLQAGAAAFFDTNGDGKNDAVLVNTGASAIEYDYAGGGGLASVNILADGGQFVTNTWVAQVGDTSPTVDFALGGTKLGVDVNYRGKTYRAVAGDSSVVEGSVAMLDVGSGNLLDVDSTLGNIGRVSISRGNLTNATSAGDITSLLVQGTISGMVSAGGTIGSISAGRLTGQIYAGPGGVGQLAVTTIDAGASIYVSQVGSLVAGSILGGAAITTQGDIGLLQAGTISGASVTAGGGIGSLIVDTLSGAPAMTFVTVGLHVGTFQAQTITGGENGMLFLTFGAGVDTFVAGAITGGSATAGGFAGNFIGITGDVKKMSVGLMSGGTADGAGSYVMLSLSIHALYDLDGSVLQAGDLKCLTASVLTGGQATNGGEASLGINIANDLASAKIGQIVGSGNVTQTGGQGGGCHGGWTYGHGGGCKDGWHYSGGCGGQGGGHSGGGSCGDPSVGIYVGHDIGKLVAGTISGGNASGDYSSSMVNIVAGHDIVQFSADTVDAGSATGAGASVSVYVTAGRDIQSISANTFSGGQATGDGALAGLYVSAGRDIDFLGASLISGTTSRRLLADPTVQFLAGGDIGFIMAGQITGGTVNSNGVTAATASVRIRADGTYVDEFGVQSAGDISQIVTGTIDGGQATGDGALAYVKISAAHDIGRLYADTISGGLSRNGGFSYVDILAEHDIQFLQAGTITGSDGRAGCDPAVVIQAYNDIECLLAQQIVAGNGGTVSILAGLDASGQVSGEVDANGNLVAGSIQKMVVGLISGNGGVVNIAAGGDIANLQVCRVISGNGEVNIVAGDDITAKIGSVQSWTLQGESGVTFSAGDKVIDVQNSIRSQYTQEDLGGAVEFPEVPDLPQ